MINALTIDVEDYFHVTAFERQVAYGDWDSYPLRVEHNTERILDILDGFSVKATFFVLGWVAQRCPRLVREIHARGHEIACHSHMHQLVYRLTPQQFRRDIFTAKRVLEDICGEAVRGYRAPSYSITARSLWALDILVEEGFSYDSSIFPINHDIYGIPGGKRFPHEIKTMAGAIKEFPISTFLLELGGWRPRVPIAGGGYLRLFPVALIREAIQRINLREQQPVVVYFHPWEIDPSQPRIRSGLKSRFRHYLNLQGMEHKIHHLLERLHFGSVRDVLADIRPACVPEDQVGAGFLKQKTAQEVIKWS
ncbi:XrtA system polysaccharide deacetylase [Pelotalea chapellei]|uniref:DUF3473 domain-containing protein n=1 Tax=Pelotalea chapellei TaxID=44671 RepID=A0ABS5U5C7_9BACT|nr:XrtA system polysaccharide deacetylase [Pelotalea chapellei]MBT1070859.1 DUF3473 domain-containing protein [Pelotalea chapellei]